MPVYEFHCRTCRQKTAFLVRNAGEFVIPACPACGSNELIRTISGFAYHKSLKTIHEEAGSPSAIPGPDYYKDPRNIGRWTEQKFKQMNMDIPSQVQETIQAAREGVMPDSVKDL